MMTRAVENAWRIGLTVFDASYLAVSEALDAQLLTADQKMIGSAKENERIGSIADYK